MVKHIVVIIWIFLRPEYLNIWIWLSSNILTKNNWVERINIKGNISKINDGAFKVARYIGKKLDTFIFLKNLAKI